MANRLYNNYDITFGIENFKAIGSRQEFPIKPITLIYGRNSAGKSTIMQALLLLRTIIFSDKGNLRPITELECFDDRIDIGSFEQYVHDQDIDRAIMLDIRFEDRETGNSFKYVFRLYHPHIIECFDYVHSKFQHEDLDEYPRKYIPRALTNQEDVTEDDIIEYSKTLYFFEFHLDEEPMIVKHYDDHDVDSLDEFLDTSAFKHILEDFEKLFRKEVTKRKNEEFPKSKNRRQLYLESIRKSIKLLSRGAEKDYGCEFGESGISTNLSNGNFIFSPSNDWFGICNLFGGLSEHGKWKEAVNEALKDALRDAKHLHKELDSFNKQFDGKPNSIRYLQVEALILIGKMNWICRNSDSVLNEFCKSMAHLGPLRTIPSRHIGDRFSHSYQDGSMLLAGLMQSGDVLEYCNETLHTIFETDFILNVEQWAQIPSEAKLQEILHKLYNFAEEDEDDGLTKPPPVFLISATRQATASCSHTSKWIAFAMTILLK